MFPVFQTSSTFSKEGGKRKENRRNILIFKSLEFIKSHFWVVIVLRWSECGCFSLSLFLFQRQLVVSVDGVSSIHFPSNNPLVDYQILSISSKRLIRFQPPRSVLFFRQVTRPVPNETISFPPHKIKRNKFSLFRLLSPNHRFNASILWLYLLPTIQWEHLGRWNNPHKHRRCMAYPPIYDPPKSENCSFWFEKKNIKIKKRSSRRLKANGASYHLSAAGSRVYLHATCFANLILRDH